MTKTDRVNLFLMVSVCAYAVQTSLLGPLRFFLSSYGLQYAWYLPDLLGLVVALMLLARGGLAIYSLFLIVVLYSVLGYFVSGSFPAVLSGLKAMFPFFLGLSIEPRSFTAPIYRLFMILLMIAAVEIGRAHV